MASLLLGIAFLAASCSFGAVFAVFVLGERRIPVVIPVSLIAGIGGYAFLLNVVSYVVPVRTAMWMVLVLLGVIGARGVWKYTRENVRWEAGGLSRKELRTVFLTAAIVSLLTGTTALRTLADSDVRMGHIPLAATIAAGNFPVLDPSAPDHRISYHYGPDLLAAALNRIAGMPLFLGYDLQIFFFTAATFLMAFLVAFELFGNFSSAYLSSLLFLYGGGFAWTHVFDGALVLIRKIAWNVQTPAPWKFLAEMTTPNFDSSVVMTVFSHTVAMGIPIMLLGIWLFWKALEDGGRMRRALFAGIAFGFLALSLETHVAVMAAAIAILCLLVLCGFFAKRPSPGRMIGVVFFSLAIALVLALFQGGILSGSDAGAFPFALAKNFWHSDITDKNVLPFRWPFFEEFGLPLLLFFPAAVAFRRDWRVSLLVAAAAIAFAVPLAIHYVPRPREMERFFGLAAPLFSFLAGGYLMRSWLGFRNQSAARTVFLAAAVAAMSLTAVWFQLFALAFPLGEIGKTNRPFLAKPAAPAALDGRAYEWIRERTKNSDRFYPYSEALVANTGRFTPGFYAAGWGYPDEIAMYRSLAPSCSLDGFTRLGIRYLYIAPALRNFEFECVRTLPAERVYQEQNPDGDFRRIYRITEKK